MVANKHILLAEDDADFRGILKQYLWMSGFSVEWAKDGEETLLLFDKGSFNMCVLDVMVPKLGGFSVAEKMIAINPEVPFIFLTARKMKEDKLKGLKLGADDYIVKPFEADELVLRLNNILKRTQRTSVAIISEEIIQIVNYQIQYEKVRISYT